MGNNNLRRERFFRENPKCCFCGGFRKAVEVDHQPPKVFFIGKASPQIGRYPSCSQCNRGSSSLDVILSFWARLDPSGKYQSSSEGQNLLVAMKNNYPNYLPELLTNREKRKWFRNMGRTKPKGILLQDIPMIGMPFNTERLIEYSVAKIAVAIYYSVFKKPAPIGSNIITLVDRNIVVEKSMLVEMFVEYLPTLVIRKNRNELAQSQFSFRHGYNEKEDLFGILIRLNSSFYCMVGVFPGKSNLYKDESTLVITKEGFPWGTSLEDLLKDGESK